MDPVTEQIVSSIKDRGGKASIADDALLAHAAAVRALPEPSRRKSIGTELLALALRLIDANRDEQYGAAFAQLLVLAAIAVGDGRWVEAELTTALGRERTHRVLGTVADKRPLAGKVEGALSPLMALIASRTPPK